MQCLLPRRVSDPLSLNSAQLKASRIDRDQKPDWRLKATFAAALCFRMLRLRCSCLIQRLSLMADTVDLIGVIVFSRDRIEFHFVFHRILNPDL